MHSAFNLSSMVPVARITSPALRRARRLPSGAWYPILDTNPAAQPAEALPHYAWVVIEGRPVHIWTGHLEIRGSPTTE
jgi:hypothetical protein